VCILGYLEGVKGYILIQPHCNKIIIRRDTKIDENVLDYKPNSTFVPSSACKASYTFVPSSTCKESSMFVPSSVPTLVSSSSNDDSEDENPPLPAHLPLDESIEPKPTPTPSLPRWVCSKREATSDIVGDPSTCSQFQ
jgi:hypothetical protein